MIKWGDYFSIKAKVKKLERQKVVVEIWHGKYTDIKRENERLLSVIKQMDKNAAEYRRQISRLMQENENYKNKFAYSMHPI